MNRSRSIMVIGIAFAALVAFGATASAQDGPTVGVDPQVGLAHLDTVTVTFSGFPADSTDFSVAQCVTPIVAFTGQCALNGVRGVALDSSGGGAIEFIVREGEIGTGTCGEGADQCVMVVGSLTEPESAAARIFFGADAPAAPAEEELADTGPSEVGISLVAAFAVLAAGVMIISTSRRRFLP